ncbi:hypothetical protein [Actinomycetospora sp. NBRC 106378]|nr:hypothetical protein [Actinomycetospora sp. NBRC 106378]GLZ51771.1 hypothetical protein Acsp07_13880 [Actinomycetospora sp. NBRC 106378]
MIVDPLDLYSCPDCGAVMEACTLTCHDNRTGGEEPLLAAMSEVHERA